MSRQQWSRVSAIAAVVLVSALWLAGIRTALDRGAMAEGAVLNAAFVFSFGAAALFGIAGAIHWFRAPRRITGPLLVLSGAAISAFLLAQWRAIDGPATWRQIAVLSIVWLRPLLVHMVLAYPVGRIRPRDRVIVVPLYVVSACLVLASVLTSPGREGGRAGALTVVEVGRLSDLLRSAQYTLFNPVVMAVVAVLLLWRLRRLPARGRRVVGPVYAAMVVVAAYDAVGSWVFTTWGGDLKFDDDGFTVIGSADLLVDWARFWLVPLALLVSVVRFGARREARIVEVQPADPDSALQVAHVDVLIEHPEVTAAARANAGLIATNVGLLDEQRRRLEQVRRARAEIVRQADAARVSLERDLHDGVQQNVLAAAIELAALDGDGGSRPDRAEIVAAACAALASARRDLDHLTRGLAPSSLQDGLRVALEHMAERSPLSLRLRYDVDRTVPSDVSNIAYFVISEAVTNSLKHASADEIRIEVVEDPAHLRVEVADDGCGMDNGATGSGTTNMRERVHSVHGTVDISGHPGRGTTVRVEIPWDRAEQ